MNKKGFIPFIPIALTAPIILSLALIVAVVLGGTTLILFVLSKSIFTLVGATILIILAVAFLMGRGTNITMWVIGGVLVAIPLIFDKLNEASLLSILG